MNRTAFIPGRMGRNTKITDNQDAFLHKLAVEGPIVPKGKEWVYLRPLENEGLVGLRGGKVWFTEIGLTFMGLKP